MKAIIIIILSVLVLYGILIEWRPFMTGPLFSYEWMLGK